MKAALYTRVSTSEQATDGNSLDAQIAALRAYSKQKDWQIWEEYTDGGYSGGTDQRPALQRLIHDAQDKRFDVLICAKLDRFFRNIRLLLDYLHQLDQLGITFISTQEALDTSTPMGKFSIQIMGVIAEFERGRIGERIKDARRISVSKNQWSSGRTPFGYRFNKETKELFIESTEADVIRFMFDHYLNDSLGIIRLAELLNSEKKTTPRIGHRKHNYWTQSAVRYVLTHAAYKGGPNESWKFKCPAIVELTTWDMVQKRLKTNRHFKATTSQRDFQGLLKCGICGHVLRIGYNHNTNPHYECPGRLKRLHLDGSEKCSLPRINADVLDKSLNTQVSEIFNNPDLFNKYVKETVKNLESEVKELERRLKPLQVENDRIKREMDVAETKFEMGRLDKESYKSIIGELSAKLRGIERQQNEADPMLLKEYKQKLDDLALCKFHDSDTHNVSPEEQEFCKQVDMDIIRMSTKALRVTKSVATDMVKHPDRYASCKSFRIGNSEAIDKLGMYFNSPRETMKKWGMVGMVYPDGIEIKGSLQGKSVVSPGYKSSHYPRFQ